MSDKTILVPLAKILITKEVKPSTGVCDGANLNNQVFSRIYIEVMLEDNDFPVMCINRTTMKKRLMPFKILYGNNERFWMQNGSWEYFLVDEDYVKLKKKAAEKQRGWEAKNSPPSGGGLNKNLDESLDNKNVQQEGDEELEELEELEAEQGYGSEYKVFAEMSTEERINFLNSNKKRLTELILRRPRDEDTVTGVLVDTAKDAAIINHAILREAIRLGDDEAKRLTQDLVDSTNEMVKSSAQLISENILNNELMNTLVQKSNGTIVQHMTRVYLNGIAFLAYYNNLVSTSSAIQKLRISFANKYRKFYQALLPHLAPDNIGLERVFYGGMRSIAPELYYKWAVGFLIHDIGKAAAVEYHEGESKYNREIVIDHVKQGYKSIMTKTNYPMEASLITGYHHEYYGDPNGYGYFRAYLQQYKKSNPGAKQDYVITYDLEPMLDYQALAYFPAKILEIVDIYDSVTDPLRAYRKAMTTDEALAMMREEFIKKHCKIDPILFDIFSSFIRKRQKQKT